MKNYLITASLIFFMACNNSPSAGRQENELQKETAQVPAVTDKHILIPYSSLYIIPPAGFEVEELTNMLTKTEEKSYSANFVPMTIVTGTTIEKMISEVKAESEKNYPGVWQQEELIVSGAPALLCRYQAVPGIKMYHLYFKDKWKDRSLIANYDEKDETTGAAMKEAMKTVVVKED